MTIDEYVDAFWPDAEILKADGFDEAFLGIATQAGGNPVAVYDREKCIDILARQIAAESLSGESQEAIREAAVEHFAFNTECAYVGPATPLFLEVIPNHKFTHEPDRT